jgi:hypothetical protein
LFWRQAAKVRTWEEVCKVLEDGVLDDVAVDGCHAVHSVAGSDSQVRHAHKPGSNKKYVWGE